MEFSLCAAAERREERQGFCGIVREERAGKGGEREEGKSGAANQKSYGPLNARRQQQGRDVEDGDDGGGGE